MNLQRIALMGKPHIGAYYFGEGDKHRLHPDSMCIICNKPATDAHHIVPKGLGGGNRVYVLETTVGIFPLRSPLFSLCRDHHEAFHQGKASVVWEWDDGEGRDQWESGYLLSHGYFPHDPRLFLFGAYVITHNGREWEVRDGVG